MPQDVQTDDGLEEAYAQPSYEGADAGDNKVDPIDRLKDKTGSGSVKGGAGSRINKAAQTFGRFVNQNRKPIIGGGGIAGIIITLIFSMSGFFGLFEAVHVAENVKQDVMKKLDHMETTESKTIMKKILAAAVRGRGTPTADSTDTNPVEKNIAETDAEGLKADIDGSGATATFDPSTGELTGLTAADGTTMDPANLSNEDLSTVTSAIPISEAEVNTDMTDVLHFQDGVTFNIIDGKDNQKIETDIAKDVVAPDGVAPAEGDPLLNDVSATEASTGDTAQAVSKGIEDIGAEVPATEDTPETFVTVGCILASIVGDGYKHRYVTLSKNLMRSSNVLFSIADQSKSGKNMSLKALGAFVSSNLNGNPNATTPEGTKGFDQSAGWKQITGQPVTSNNPGINPAADPNTPLSGWSSSLQFLTTNAATSVSCGVILNPVVQWVGSIATDIGEAIVNIPDGESVNVADLGTSVAIHAALNGGGIIATNKATQTGPVKSIISRISNIILGAADLAVTGNENAVQFLNNAKLGGDMSANTTARYLGGHRLTKTSALAMSAAANNEQATKLAKSSLWNQTMSLANVNSIASRFLIQIPITKAQFIGDILQIPHLPAIMLGTIQSMFNSTASASNAANFSNSQQFGLTDAELAQYGIADNSDYMTNPARGISVPLTATTSVMVPRIFILGDPSKYLPSQGDIAPCAGTADPTTGNTTSVGSCPHPSSYLGAPVNHNALLGCYVNAVEDPSAANSTVCGGMLDFAENDNPTNISDSIFTQMYCSGSPPISNGKVTNYCHASTDNEMVRYGKFILDYHLTRTFMQYANASAGFPPAPDDGSGG